MYGASGDAHGIDQAVWEGINLQGRRPPRWGVKPKSHGPHRGWLAGGSGHGLELGASGRDGWLGGGAGLVEVELSVRLPDESHELLHEPFGDVPRLGFEDDLTAVGLQPDDRPSGAVGLELDHLAAEAGGHGGCVLRLTLHRRDVRWPRDHSSHSGEGVRLVLTAFALCDPQHLRAETDTLPCASDRHVGFPSDRGSNGSNTNT